MLQNLTHHFHYYHLTATFHSEIHHRLIFSKNNLICYIMINNIGDSINDINGGSPKSSILKGFSIVNHPFGSTLIYGNPHVDSAVSMPPVHLNDSCLSAIRFATSRRTDFSPRVMLRRCAKGELRSRSATSFLGQGTGIGWDWGSQG